MFIKMAMSLEGQTKTVWFRPGMFPKGSYWRRGGGVWKVIVAWGTTLITASRAAK